MKKSPSSISPISKAARLNESFHYIKQGKIMALLVIKIQQAESSRTSYELSELTSHELFHPPQCEAETTTIQHHPLGGDDATSPPGHRDSASPSRRWRRYLPARLAVIRKSPLPPTAKLL
jgi:hypothetical protein